MNKQSRIVEMSFVLCLANFMMVFASARQPTLAGADISDLLVQLRSPDWTVRANAYERLRADPTALARPDVRRPLLNLLERENQLVDATLRASHEEVGISSKYGEGF